MRIQIISLFIILIIGCAFTFPISNGDLPTNTASLGEELFFSKILSSDKSISCSSCHKPEFAFADTAALSHGVNGGLTSRNAPSVMNQLNRELFFWDGRAKSLEEQALGPITNPNEMNLPIDSAVMRLKSDLYFNLAFNKFFDDGVTSKNIGTVFRDFEQSLETGATPFDEFMRGNKKSISQSAIRGREIFMNKGKCFTCHFGPDFTSDEFKNIGLYNAKEWNDVGRYTVTKDSLDIGKFKVPSLRNVSLTAPYMHNGKFKTLREVIDYYNKPNEKISNSINQDIVISNINLTEKEKIDLENFLLTLTETNSLQRFKNRQ